MNLLIILVTLAVFAYLAFSKQCRESSDWKATVTPLASIMGSGFLVSMPLLAGSVGVMAPFFMTALLILAYLVGSAIRYNIRYFEPVEHQAGRTQDIAWLSRIVLAAAYFISVAYYLQLLAAFLLSALSIEGAILANTITTTLLACIGIIGICRGLKTLESVERYAVSLNLAMIAALLVALVVYNASAVLKGDWQLHIPSHIDIESLRIVLGLLIVVQGFETSRYLGAEHPAEQRIRTMRHAQLLSSAIYLCFIGLALVLYQNGTGSDVTAIIQMTKPVAIVLPILIAIAAVGSQFSAAVADNAGAGGLLLDLSRNRLSPKLTYGIILTVTVAMTWLTDVNQIIAYASRAFALFYSIQCMIAYLISKQNPETPAVRRVVFLATGLLCLCVFAFGLPAE